MKNTINQRYLAYLHRYPLLTKALTAAFFNAFGEQLASRIAGDLSHVTIHICGKSLSLSSAFSLRVPLMALYGFAVNAPFAHYAYGLLNRVFGSKLSQRKKILQIIVSMATITPIMAFLMVFYLALIANAHPNRFVKSLRARDWKACDRQLKTLYRQVLQTLKTNLMPVIKSSWITSPCFMAIAQKYLDQSTWVVFFTICYFILGTYNNTKVKLSKK